MKKVLVCGAGGFIGGHLVKKLKDEGYWVRGVDIKAHEFTELPCDEFELLASNQIANDQETFAATPAISQGQIFLRSSKRLYCVANE